MFCANRDPRRPPAKLGMGGQISRGAPSSPRVRTTSWCRRRARGDHTAILRPDGGLRSASGSSDVPVAVVFPSEGQQSPRLVPESVLGIRILKRGYVAQYDFGKAFVVREASTDSPLP